MRYRNLTLVHTLGPEGPKRSTYELASNLGYSTRGARCSWVRLPEGVPSLKERPGYGKLYWDYHSPWGDPEANFTATALLRDPDTVWIKGAMLRDDWVVVQHAFLVFTEPRRVPALRIGDQWNSAEVREWLVENRADHCFAVIPDKQGKWLVQVATQASATEVHREFVERMRPKFNEMTPDEINAALRPIDLTKTLLHAKMRWV